MKQSTWNAWFILSSLLALSFMLCVIFCDPTAKAILISPTFLIMSLMAFSNMFLCIHVGRKMYN